MKSRKKKLKTIELDHNEQGFESVVDDLTEAVVEELRDEHVSALEPFEQYAHKVRGKMHADFKNFRTRFVKGYNALMEELLHEQEAQVKHPPSKGNIRP